MASFDSKPEKKNVQTKKDTGQRMPPEKAPHGNAPFLARSAAKGMGGAAGDATNGNQPYDIVTEGPNGQVGLSSVDEAIAQKKGLFLKRNDGEVFFRRASTVQLFRNHPTVVQSKNQVSRQIAALRRKQAEQMEAEAADQASSQAMTIAPANSPQEAEADRVADKVVSRKKGVTTPDPSSSNWAYQMKRLMRTVAIQRQGANGPSTVPVSYTHLRAHETSLHLVCRLLFEKIFFF